MTIVFKVCLSWHGARVSVLPLTTSRYCCRYNLGEWTVAPIGGLFCFNDLPYARYFAQGLAKVGHEPVILICQAEEPVSGIPTQPALAQTGDEAIEHAWQDKGDPMSLPGGTVFYKRVKPLEVLPND